jgi:hypothetical protein
MIPRIKYERPLADDRTQTVPALDIEEILQKRPWEHGPLTEQQRADLEEGVQFLDLVLRGRDMAEEAVSHHIVSGNLAAIKAYNLASRAYRRYPHAADQDFHETICKTQKLLREILDKEELEIKPDEKELAVARDLFYLLAAMSVDLWYADPFPLSVQSLSLKRCPR